MEVHNLMEDYVQQRIKEIYTQLTEKKIEWLTCNCESCQMDALCYVLNRIKPSYIISGRGHVYANQKMENQQLKADVDAVAIEAIRVISSIQRPYHKIVAKQKEISGNPENIPYYNFPVFSGTVYDGTTFEPLIDAKITLKDKNGNTPMQDFSWTNPSKTYKPTNGSYTFWPQSLTAENLGSTRKFNFTVEVTAEGYYPASYAFDIILESQEGIKNTINQSLTVKIQDLFLFKE